MKEKDVEIRSCVGVKGHMASMAWLLVFVI